MSSNTVILFPRDETGEPAPEQIYLHLIAAPSVPGLLGSSGATFMVAGYLTHCCDNTMTDLYPAAFAATCGSLTQVAASRSDRKPRALPDVDARQGRARLVLQDSKTGSSDEPDCGWHDAVEIDCAVESA